MKYYLRLASDHNRVVTEPGTANTQYWETRAQATRYIEDHYRGLIGTDFDIEVATYLEPGSGYQSALGQVLTIFRDLTPEDQLSMLDDLFALSSDI